MELTTPQPEDWILSWPELSAIIGLSRVTIWALRRAGQFPQPVRLSANRIGWRQSAIREWVASRKNA